MPHLSGVEGNRVAVVGFNVNASEKAGFTDSLTTVNNAIDTFNNSYCYDTNKHTG